MDSNNRQSWILLSVFCVLSIAGMTSALDTMYASQVLNVWDTLTSPNNCFRLVMQDDGNLVLYRNSNSQPIWASRTTDTGTVRAKMQGDGNFVLYTNGNTAKWASNTSGKCGAKLVIQNDGNLVIYTADTGSVAWATNTQTNC